MVQRRPIRSSEWNRWNRKTSRSSTISSTFASKDKLWRTLRTKPIELGIYCRINHPISFKNGSFAFSTKSSRHQPSKSNLLLHEFFQIPSASLIRYPLVSGLYRFATLVMNICLKLNYFQVIAEYSIIVVSDPDVLFSRIVECTRFVLTSNWWMSRLMRTNKWHRSAHWCDGLLMKFLLGKNSIEMIYWFHACSSSFPYRPNVLITISQITYQGSK